MVYFHSISQSGCFIREYSYSSIKIIYRKVLISFVPLMFPYILCMLVISLYVFTQTGHRSVDASIQNVRSQMDKVKILHLLPVCVYIYICYTCLGLEKPSRHFSNCYQGSTNSSSYKHHRGEETKEKKNLSKQKKC